jgi:hypothetical protein
MVREEIIIGASSAAAFAKARVAAKRDAWIAA